VNLKIIEKGKDLQYYQKWLRACIIYQFKFADGVQEDFPEKDWREAFNLAEGEDIKNYVLRFYRTLLEGKKCLQEDVIATERSIYAIEQIRKKMKPDKLKQFINKCLMRPQDLNAAEWDN